MKKLILLLLPLAMLRACTGDGTGLGGSGVHGNVSTTYTQDANDPNTGKIAVGGQLNFAKQRHPKNTSGK